jgi:hypothetical protein
MTSNSGAAEDLVAAATASRLGAAMTGCQQMGPHNCRLRLVPPRDPLTRLLMEADGVTDAALDALVRNIAKVIAHRHRL